MATFLMTLLMLAGVFLMFIVLLQRGRGGGLAGAFGGAGGQSVLGVKAGDVFTKITVGIALAWVILAGVSGLAARNDDSRYEAGEDADDEVEDEASKTEDADLEESSESSKTEDSKTGGSLIDDLKNESAGTPDTDSDDDDSDPEAGGTGEPGSEEKTEPPSGDEKKESSDN